MSKRLRTLFAVSYALGLGAVALAFVQPSYASPWEMLLFIALSYAADWLAVELPRKGSASVSLGIHMAAMLLFGLRVPVLAGVVSAFQVVEIREGKRLSGVLFNASQVAIANVAVYAVFTGLGGTPAFATGSLSTWSTVALLIGVPFGFMVNSGLVSTAIAFVRDQKPLRVWEANFKWQIPSTMALALLGVLMAATYVAAGLPGILLVGIPLVVARQTFVVYMRRRSAYYETVHSLVAAIEAKDPYTRGHSERVAEYAEQTAEALDLGSEEIDRIRFAALLHDLGKIGVDRRILNKPGKLTDEEYAEIKEHPDLAARILGEIDFLKPSIPSIRSHHERIDGGGYGQGIEGSNIPLHGRILGVVDAFDAMTSARPYRPPHSVEEAVAELLEHAGSQFDPKVVNVFIHALRLEGMVEASVAAKEGQLNLEDARS